MKTINHFTITSFCSFLCLLGITVLPAADEIQGVILTSQQANSVLVNGFPVLEDPTLTGGTTTADFAPYLKASGNRIDILLPRNTIAAEAGALIRFHVATRPASDAEFLPIIQLERTLLRPASVEVGVLLPLGETVELVATGQQKRKLSTTILDTQSAQGGWDVATSAIAHNLTSAASPIQDHWTLTGVIAPSPLLTLPWEGQAPVLTDSDRGAIRALVTQLNTAIQARDFPTIEQLLLSKVQRFAAARGVTEAEIRAALTASFDNLTTEYTFAAVDSAVLQFVSYPDTSLIEVRLADGPPINAVNGTDTFSKRVFVVKTADGWRIVD